jgi:hypothetical protein
LTLRFPPVCQSGSMMDTEQTTVIYVGMSDLTPSLTL